MRSPTVSLADHSREPSSIWTHSRYKSWLKFCLCSPGESILFHLRFHPSTSFAMHSRSILSVVFFAILAVAGALPVRAVTAPCTALLIMLSFDVQVARSVAAEIEAVSLFAISFGTRSLTTWAETDGRDLWAELQGCIALSACKATSNACLPFHIWKSVKGQRFIMSVFKPSRACKTIGACDM
jgi:hypothetical protein